MEIYTVDQIIEAVDTSKTENTCKTEDTNKTEDDKMTIIKMSSERENKEFKLPKDVLEHSGIRDASR